MAGPGDASRTRRTDAGSKLSGEEAGRLVSEHRPAEQRGSGGEDGGPRRRSHANAPIAVTRAQDGRPGDPATRRPGDPATRRPGDPATRRPGDPATRRPGDPATRRPGDPATRRPGDPATRRPGDPATRRPGDPATRRPGDPATRRPGDPATRRPGDPAYCIGNRKPACQADFPGSRRKSRRNLLYASDHRQITPVKGEPETVATRRHRSSHDILHWPCTNIAAGKEAIECDHVGPRRRMAVPVIVAAQRTTGPGERAPLSVLAVFDGGVIELFDGFRSSGGG